MATTNGNRKILDLKRWEIVTPAPASTSAGAFLASSRHYRQQQLFISGQTAAWIYNPNEDGWVLLPSPGLQNVLGNGACGVAGSWSTGTATGASTITATGGSTSTINTGITLARNLAGYKVHIVSGPNAGATLDISSNTVGTNATITVPTQGSAFTSSTVFRLCAPVFYVLSNGTIGAASFRKYDFATNTWTSLSSTGLATVGTDAKLITTPSFINNDYIDFASGTATSGGASTISNSAKSWTTNQWTNYQIRIVSGTGAGQIRTISSNTGTQITVSSAWTTQPDNTSVYSIEGNDDFVYFIGNNAVTLYRYTISTNTWSTITPVAARSGAPSTALSATWVYGVTDERWTDESAIINGQRIYSFRGGANAALDYYDIAANTWVSSVTYSPGLETFSTGTKYTYVGDYLYIQKDATHRFFRYSFADQQMDGWTTLPLTSGTAIIGDTLFDVTYYDGATEIHYVYFLLNSNSVMYRQMII